LLRLFFMLNKNKKNEQFDLRRYETDVTGVSLKKLETGLWWMKNRLRLKKIFIFFLLFSIFLSWGYSLYGVGKYIFFEMAENEKMIVQLVNTETGGLSLLTSRDAEKIIISSFGALKNSSNYDFYAVIKNPNEKYWGKFSYCFNYGREKSTCGENFILPAQKKYILALNLKNISSPSNLNFAIKEISWQRINSHEIPDWPKYSQERSDIEIKNISLAAEDGNSNVVSFSARNNTSFGFWKVPLIIVETKLGKVSNVNYYELKELLSFEERGIKINWAGEEAITGEVRIYPDINIMDKSVYMAP
jgi:hypothetical protein